MTTLGRILTLCVFALAIGGCGSDTATVSASDMGGVLSAITTGVGLVGTGMSGAARLNGRGVDDVCDEHASVKSTAAVSGDPAYPALVHYCLLAKNTNSPDSVQGAYALLKSVTCGINAAGGIAFDGVAQSKTITISTACFSQKMVDEMGTTSLSATVTGSLTPTFAPNYSHGVEIVVAAPASMTFKFATKVSGTIAYFTSFEQGQGTGGFAGAYDSATGKVWYEGRMDRFDARGRDTGWSRHIRIYADTAGTGRAVTLDDYSGISADVNKSGFSGRVATAQGSSAAGLKVYENNHGGGDRTSLANPTDSHWAATGNACNALGGSGTCAGISGIDVKSAAANGNFFLIPTNSTYTAAAAWVAANTGLTFTTATFAD